MEKLEKRNLMQEYKKEVNQMLYNKETEKILPFLKKQMDIIKFDNDLMTLWYLCMIAEKEKAAGKQTILEKKNNISELVERYCQLKFSLRRIENDVMDNPEEFWRFLVNQKISEYELIGVIDSSIYNKEKVWNYFQG